MTREQLLRLRTDPMHRMTTEEWFELCDMAEKYMDAKNIFGKGPDILVAREVMMKMVTKVVANTGETTVGNREDAEEASPPTSSGCPPLWPPQQRTTTKYLPCRIDVRGDCLTCLVCGTHWRGGDDEPPCPKDLDAA